MPVDLNKHDLDSLTTAIAELEHGRSVITNDGLIVRKRPSTPGYDCGVGRGGYGNLRLNTAIEAARYMLSKSAANSDKTSLGGTTSFTDFEKAIESVRTGEVKPTGPNPAVQALRKVASKAGLHSYRIRAQQARDALARGDVAAAMRQIEAIVEHAGANGRHKDVERAEKALDEIREHNELANIPLPQLKATKIDIVVRGSKHYLYRNGVEVAGPLPREELEKRKAFLTRQAARNEDVAAIDDELANLPSVLTQSDDEVVAA